MDWATWGPVIAGAGVAGTSAYMANRQSNKNRQAQQQEAALDRSAAAGRNTADVALEESMADPFRHQLGQARTLAALDLIARGRNTPTKIAVPAGMEQFVPKISGGFSYEMNPDVRSAAQRLQQDVASGRTAPTMTDPANYGKTAALNLRNPSAAPGAGAPGGTMPGTSAGSGGGTAVPRAGSAAATSTSLGDDDFISSIFDPSAGGYERRGGGTGGVGGGAYKGASLGSVAGPVGMGVGALIGGIVGAAKKHAKSAPFDFTVEQARDAVAKTFQEYHGRQASPEEIDAAIRGQGWKPGQRWVGAGGLRAVIDAIASQGRQQQSAQLTPSYAGLFA